MLRWENDDAYMPHLSAHDAKRVAASVLPEFRGNVWARPAVVREYDTWIVDACWVVRIARRPAEADKLEREWELLKAVTLPIAVPRIEYRARGIAVYRFLPGATPVSAPPERLWPGLARQFADFLSVLHATPLDVGERARLDMRGEGHVVVSHSDLKREHVLLSEDESLLIGVIDWADVELCPPERDFAGLVASFGPRFAALVADSYAGRVDLDAAIADARAWALRSLADAEAGKKDWPLETGWTEHDHARASAARAEHFREVVRTILDE